MLRRCDTASVCGTFNNLKIYNNFKKWDAEPQSIILLVVFLSSRLVEN
jgi:hypothetical protein